MRFCILAGALMLLVGCGAVEPTTEFSMGVFGTKFVDTKDNNVSVKGLKWKDLEMEELIIRNNASDVMTANVAQMAALNEQMKIHGENIRAGIAELSGLVRAATPMAGLFAPGVSATGPLGTSFGMNSATTEALIERIADVVIQKTKAAASQPTTQSVN